MKARIVGVAVLVVALLSVSACGSSSGSGSAAATTTAASPTPTAPAESPAPSATTGAPAATSSTPPAATSSTAGTAASAGTPDVCTVLPFARAAQLTGQPYTQGVPTSSDGTSGCAYDNDDATVPGLNVTILRDDDGDTWSVVHTGGVTDIAGLGDKALWDNDNTLYAAKATDLVQVNGDSVTQDQAEALARVVITALP